MVESYYLGDDPRMAVNHPTRVTVEGRVVARARVAEVTAREAAYAKAWQEGGKEGAMAFWVNDMMTRTVITQWPMPLLLRHDLTEAYGLTSQRVWLHKDGLVETRVHCAAPYAANPDCRVLNPK